MRMKWLVLTLLLAVSASAQPVIVPTGLAPAFVPAPNAPVLIGGGSGGGGGGGASIITPDVDLLAFNLSDTTTSRIIEDCPPPCPVHLDATSTTATGKIITQLTFIWDFGDSDAGTVPRGGINRSLNTSGSAPVAFHSYEPTSYPDNCGAGASTCKVYTGSLTVYAVDGASVVNQALPFTVQVENPDTTWPGAATDCYGASATGCPAGADFLGATPAFNACQTAATRVLFEKGQTFTMSAGQTVGSFKCRWGSYGSGADPIIDVTVASGGSITANSTCGGHRIVGIDFNGPGAGAVDLLNGGSCLLLHDSDVSAVPGDEFSQILSAPDGTPPISNSQIYAYKARARNLGYTVGSAQGAAWFCSCEKSAVVGSELGNVNGDTEQTVRHAQFDRVVIDANEFFENAASANKDTIALRNGSNVDNEWAPSVYAVFSRNSCSVDFITCVKVGETNSGNTANNARIQNIWIAENSFEVGLGLGSAFVQLQVNGNATNPGYTEDIVFALNYGNESNKAHAAGNGVRFLDDVAGGTGTKAGRRAIGNTFIYNGATTLTSSPTLIEFATTAGAVCANNTFSLKMSGTPTICGSSVPNETNFEESQASPSDLWSVTAGYPAGTNIDFNALRINSSDTNLDSTGTALIEPPIVRDVFGNTCPNGLTEIGGHCIAD